MMQPHAEQRIGEPRSATLRAGLPAFGYPGYASAAGAFGVGR